MMYYFLIASLPTLEIGTPAPLTVADFDAVLEENLTEKELDIICSGAESTDSQAANRVYAGMARFDEYLRTVIARKRADLAGKQFNGAEPEEFYSEVDHGMTQASSCSDPLEREYLIDRMRWARLDELALGHDFDFDALCIYRMKLVIVNKYTNFCSETGTVNFTAALDKVISDAGRSTKES